MGLEVWEDTLLLLETGYDPRPPAPGRPFPAAPSPASWAQGRAQTSEGSSGYKRAQTTGR